MFFDLRKGKGGNAFLMRELICSRRGPPSPRLHPASAPCLWGQTGLMECEKQDWFSEGTGPSALS